MLVLFALSLPVVLLMAGLVIDGGYAFAQRRVAQNTADLSALAAARVMAQFVSGDTTNGTDANVKLAIDDTVAANNGVPVRSPANMPSMLSGPSGSAPCGMRSQSIRAPIPYPPR
ncbi:MAG: pilus assembly protein TadG-related protein, partial [Propionibacterium sp.]|nr:pilus assembly protein TadG-related protein [Propionibacterium sp.]